MAAFHASPSALCSVYCESRTLWQSAVTESQADLWPLLGDPDFWHTTKQSNLIYFQRLRLTASGWTAVDGHQHLFMYLYDCHILCSILSELITNVLNCTLFLFICCFQFVNCYLKWIYTVPQKSIPNIFDCNLKTNYQILTIFGTNIPDTACHQITVQFPTSPNVCFSTT